MPPFFMLRMATALTVDTVAAWIAEYTQDDDFFVVSVTLPASDAIEVEVDRDAGISSDECAALNRHLLSHLEAEGLDVSVTVSSPGLTTPMRLPRQFRKNVGRDVEVVLPDGSKLTGRLVRADEAGISVCYEAKERLEGRKRPTMVSHEASWTYGELKRVTLIIGKRSRRDE